MPRRRHRNPAPDAFDEFEAPVFDDDTEPAAGKSKSQVKRELLALDPLVEEIVELPDRQLAGLPLSEHLASALRAARPLKRGARKRQLRYCRGLLADEDHAAVATAVAALKQPQRAQVAALHELEDWRERLIDGDEAFAAELVARYPALDAAHLRQLVAGARAEREAGAAPRAARALFRLLGEIRGPARAG